MEKERQEALNRLRHSAAHVMAQAVKHLFPEAKVTIGPPTADGFYYDFDKPTPFTPEDLAQIEAEMLRCIQADYPFERRPISKPEALALFTQMEEPYKVEMISETPDDEPMSVYQQGDFVDWCRGPHVGRTGEIGAFKLLNVAGAYWRGDEHNKMLQRIYGTAFFTQEELDDFLHRLEEARRRDHRKLGRELELFTIIPEIGAGLPVWLPKGATVRRVLEEYILERERQAGYQHVYTPHLAKVDLYKLSGHWDHYREAMFPPMELEHEQVVLRPMNCPHHFMIYKQKAHSYRELPIRIGELGTMYRFEKSGELAGLARVRSMTLNDAHIFCRPEQIQQEVTGVVRLIQEVYQKLGFKDYWYRLSLRDPADTEKYVANDEMWNRAESMLAQALDDLGLTYRAMTGEAAFYGPKIDVQVPNVMGKDETISTVQLDFVMPERFDLEYVGEDSQKHRPVVIHRGVVSTLERILAFLIEHYAGAFPLWLAPVQMRLLPIADRHLEYSQSVAGRLREAGLRVEVDERNEKVGYKIREAQLQKIPYMLVVGDKEASAGTVAVRSRDAGDLGPRPVEELLQQARAELTGD
jgi:threonyl-tRNA synthetase